MILKKCYRIAIFPRYLYEQKSKKGWKNSTRINSYYAVILTVYAEFS